MLDAQDGGEHQVDHATVADHDDRVPGVRADQPVDRARDPPVEVVTTVCIRPHVARRVVEAGITVRLEFLERDVRRGVPVELGDVVDHGRGQAEPAGERCCRLDRPTERAGVDRVDRLGAQIVGEQLGLPVPVVGQLRIGGTGRQHFSFGKRVAHQDEFHCC